MPSAPDWHTATNFAALKEALGATRVMHVAERGGWNAREARTDEMEVWLGAPEDELPASARSWAAGDGPWVLGGEDEGLVVHHVPGHSLGSVVLHMDDKVLFTGDHLAFSQRAKLLGFGSKHTRDYPAQIESVRALSGLPFEWVLPGHGRPYRVSPPTEENARLAIEGAANDMEAGLLDV